MKGIRPDLLSVSLAASAAVRLHLIGLEDVLRFSKNWSDHSAILLSAYGRRPLPVGGFPSALVSAVAAGEFILTYHYGPYVDVLFHLAQLARRRCSSGVIFLLIGEQGHIEALHSLILRHDLPIEVFQVTKSSEVKRFIRRRREVLAPTVVFTDVPISETTGLIQTFEAQKFVGHFAIGFDKVRALVGVQNCVIAYGELDDQAGKCELFCYECSSVETLYSKFFELIVSSPWAWEKIADSHYFMNPKVSQDKEYIFFHDADAGFLIHCASMDIFETSSELNSILQHQTSAQPVFRDMRVDASLLEAEDGQDLELDVAVCR